jgi:hypothetical protein
MLSVAISMSSLMANEQKSITADVKSTQAYYAAEAGIEDALLRLKKNPAISTLTYNFNIINGVSVAVNIPNTILTSKSITSQATNQDIIRNIQAVCSIGNTSGISFYYGVMVGAGGLIMNNGSEIVGNVFSGGNVSGSGKIDYNLIVSGNGHSISGVYVQGDAMAYSCLSGASVNNLTYVTGGAHTCTIRGTTSMQSQEISEQPMPIPQNQIDEWKVAAAVGEQIVGNKTISDVSNNLGPTVITGNLTLNNNAVLTITGVVYVKGNVTLGNNATMKLSNSYGPEGGVFLTDGIISMGTGDTFYGSGQTGSYLLILSTNASDDAISVKNNSIGAVFYTSSGGLNISNNVSLVEATGYKVIMNNNSKVQYSSGIVNIYFSSGPSGGWKVTDWQEQ